MTLRVAYMTGQYPRATDTFIQREVAALRQSGVEVHTMSVRRPADKEIVSPEVAAERDRTFYVLPRGVVALADAQLRALGDSPRRYFKTLAMALRLRPAGLKGMVWQMAYFAEAAVVARHVKENGVQHLHNHFSNSSCSVAMLAAELGGFTYSFTMHGPSEFFAPEYWRLGDKIDRALFVSCISHFARSQGMIFGPQDKWDRMHIVHCGVNPGTYPAKVHSGRGSRLLFVGRLAAVKGVPLLLQSMKSLVGRFPDLQLDLAGDGSDRPALEAQARELGIAGHVRFLGYQSQTQVRGLLQDADAFVLPSFAEGVPVVLMEAMAAGLPVIATRVAGVGELVDHGVSGLVIPPGDVESLTSAIESLLSDDSLRSRLAAAGRTKVEADYDISKESQWLCEVMTSHLDGKVPPIRRIPDARPTE